MTEGLIPGMSSWLHVKTSLLFLRNWMSDSLICGGRSAPILVIFSRLPSSNLIVSNSSDGFTRVFRSWIVIVWFYPSVPREAR